MISVGITAYHFERAVIVKLSLGVNMFWILCCPNHVFYLEDIMFPICFVGGIGFAQS